MNIVPELVLEHIFSFLDKDICCRNVNDLSIIATNKYLSWFYKVHFKYYIYEFTDLKKYKNILKFSRTGIHAPKNLRFCSRQCNYLNKKELTRLKYILHRFTTVINPGLYKKKINIFSNSTNENLCSPINVHFDTTQELDNFKIKMNLLGSNIWFDSRSCCNGKGCDIEIIK
tara:strand:- start:399 stop:914 length:516 start_codon:yes stop_codon:yes gene_type:complete